MRKLMLSAMAIAVLVSSMGSVNLNVVSRETGLQDICRSLQDICRSLQDICRAPPSWIYSFLGNFPEARQVPAFLDEQVKDIGALIPNISGLINGLPVGKGSALEEWIIDTGPRYL